MDVQVTNICPQHYLCFAMSFRVQLGRCPASGGRGQCPRTPTIKTNTMRAIGTSEMIQGFRGLPPSAAGASNKRPIADEWFSGLGRSNDNNTNLFRWKAMLASIFY